MHSKFVNICLASVLLTLPAGTSRAAEPPLAQIEVGPSTPLIEHRDGQQLLNFDFLVKNLSDRALRINRIQVSVFDRSDKLILRKSLDENGVGGQSGMATVPKRELTPKGELYVFNPFYSFPDQVKVGRMDYRVFLIKSDAPVGSLLAFDSFVDVSVRPQDYRDKVNLILPIARRSIIFDGHDFYSHHRRFDLTDPRARAAGLTQNGLRYAYDFMPLGADDATYAGSPYKKENWYGYGSPVYAPGDGVVVAAENAVPENQYNGTEEVYGFSSLAQLSGNFVTIDHGNGEFSTLLHMKTGSVTVKKGDRVRQGQLLGEVGFSGDALMPHLHYQLTNAPSEFAADGLPSYFHNFRRLLGAASVTLRSGQVDTGDIVEPVNASPYQKSGK
jgi:hypothetical protein